MTLEKLLITFIIAWALAAAFAVGAIFLATAAHAHSWYSEKRDPVTGGGCCGIHDCAVLTITPGVLDAVEDGYHIRLTAEQAKKINPSRNVPVDTVIPWDRVQPSEDGNWHICLPTYPVGSMNRDFFCFFAPPDT